jgi:hypothetical protein
MADPYKPPVIAPTTRTYLGAVCGNDPSHGQLRYRSNGGCVMCIKLNAFDRYQDNRALRQSPRVKAWKVNAHKAHLAAALLKLQEAAIEFRAAKENAERGTWIATIERHGIPRKSVAWMRRWLEEKERSERTGKQAKDAARSWMD